MSFDFFFFFKQKTAYEMRISDWSSDVCSSDLTQAAVELLPCDAYVGQVPRSHIWVKMCNPVVRRPCGVTNLPWFIEAHLPHLGLKKSEIGRASCRERVCQYV